MCDTNGAVSFWKGRPCTRLVTEVEPLVPSERRVKGGLTQECEHQCRCRAAWCKGSPTWQLDCQAGDSAIGQ